MAINYSKTNWVNGQAPAINSINLNKIEQGIKSACDSVDNARGVVSKSTNTLSVGANSFLAGQTLNFNLDNNNAVPVAIAGYSCTGTNRTLITFNQMYISDASAGRGTINFELRNHSSSAINNLVITFYILAV